MPETWDQLKEKMRAQAEANAADPDYVDPLTKPEVQELLKKLPGVTVLAVTVPANRAGRKNPNAQV